MTTKKEVLRAKRTPNGCQNCKQFAYDSVTGRCPLCNILKGQTVLKRLLDEVPLFCDCGNTMRFEANQLIGVCEDCI